MSTPLTDPPGESSLGSELRTAGVVQHLRVIAETTTREADDLLARARDDVRAAQNLQQLAERSAQEARRLQLLAEGNLRHTEERLATILRSIGDGVIATDADGHVIFMNEVAERLAGSSQKDALGKASSQVLRLIDPTTEAELDSVVERALRQNETVELDDRAILVSADGTRRVIEDSAAPVRDIDGNLIGSVVVFRDVTQRAKDHERLRLLSLVAEKALNGVLITDEHERLVYVNAAMQGMSGFSAEELLGKRPQDVLQGAATDPQTRRVLREAIDARQPVYVEILNYDKSGTPYWVELHIAPSLAGNRLTHFISIQADVTARRLAQDSLKEADARKTEFIATIAHELRNPLAPIRNAVQVMRLAREDPAAQERARQIIERQLAQMVRLVDDLLDISRISRGKLELRKERVTIQSAIQAALEVSRPLIDSARHSLTIEMPELPVQVHADPLRLAQVVVNLLNNAAKYTEPGGQIWLTVRAEDPNVVIQVRDTGMGIAPEALSHLFDPFSQADEAASRRQGGIGIGLALVKSLVGLLGGQVEARSDGVGRGSEFTVRLPIVHEGQHAEVLPNPVLTPAAAAAHRILVVDDHVDARDSLAMFLELLGHEVHTARDGPSAIEMASEFKPEIVLLDIGMPGMSGYTVASRIRADAGEHAPLIVAVTGWGQEEDRRRSEESGIDRHLVKPVEFDELLQVLADYLGGSRPSA